MSRAVPLLAVVILGAGGGCGGGGDRYDYAASEGAARYAELCAVCHGEEGQGGLGPVLVDSPRTLEHLRDTIETRMPPNDPSRCTGACADELARFIRDGLRADALACDGVEPSPRQLRLLTRREYRATVRDLFGDDAPALACARATDCAYRDGCVAGACEPSACNAHTFVFDPQGRALSTVHVAGTFNGWAGTVAAGGLALTRDADGLFVGTFTLPEGTSAYKLVLDEGEWVTDPRGTATQPDGFGGQNSVLALSCSDSGGDDPTVGFPAETRPAGFLFDDHAGAGVVTSVHLDAYLAAAESLADRLAAAAATRWPCDWAGDRGGCADALLDTTARGVLRRRPTADERARYRALIVDAASATEGVATALHAMLVSPAFLYRAELGEPHGDGYRLTGDEVAAALSYGLWGTTPDAALWAAADAGELTTPDGIERHVRRMLDDPRARDLVGRFALQWVSGEAIETVDKQPDRFAGFDARVRAALAAETRNFAAHVVFDGGGTLRELLTADYTVVDEVAAAHYGMPGVTGGPRPVPYGDGRRAGVLGHATMLATQAHSDQTSPIRRGLFVRRNLLCHDLPPPPPTAGGVPDVDPDATTRERFAQHTADPVCAGCHTYIDGLGFGFEHFDPVGRWRDDEDGRPIDATGEVRGLEGLGTGAGATPYATVPELAAMLADSDAAAACFVRQSFRFTRGYVETLAERCARRSLTERFRASGGDIRELLVDLFVSPDFLERR